MDLSVPEAAERLGLTPQRVNALLLSGQIRGRKVGGRWVIEESETLKLRRLTRPMSQRVAWAAILGPDNADWLSQPDRSKLKSRLRQLASHEQPGRQIASWLASRANPIDLSAPAGAASRLAGDPDLVPSGISDPRSGLSGGSEIEFYAQPGKLEHVIRRHLLVESPSGNVRLREAAVPLANPVPLLLLAADLADRNGPRELAAANRIAANSSDR